MYYQSQSFLPWKLYNFKLKSIITTPSVIQNPGFLAKLLTLNFLYRRTIDNFSLIVNYWTKLQEIELKNHICDVTMLSLSGELQNFACK